MVKNSTWEPGHMCSWETVKSEILYSVSDSTVPGTMENWNYMQVETFWRAGTYRSPLSIHLSCSGTSCMGYESMPCMEKGGNPLLNWLLGYYKWPCWYGQLCSTFCSSKHVVKAVERVRRPASAYGPIPRHRNRTLWTSAISSNTRE